MRSCPDTDIDPSKVSYRQSNKILLHQAISIIFFGDIENGGG